MCGRYTLSDPDKLSERYNVTLPKELKPNFNVAPTQTMPVITLGPDGRIVQLMRWGIPRFIGPGKVKDVFNTRADKAFGSWKQLVSTQRVLVPATGFYEWKKLADGKQPYFIHPIGVELFSFAGIWGIWKDDEGKEIKTYSIMTIEPNKEMTAIHNRMPVILQPQEEEYWLADATNNDRGAIETLLEPLGDGELDMYEVSRDVNVARTNDERLSMPLNSR